MTRAIAIYLRVSSRKQDTRSQEPDLERWVTAFADLPVKWFRDTMTGRTMDRPGWRKLEEAMHAGEIAKIVVWRLDRLGRTAAGLTALFEDLQRLGVGFESLKDRVDLSTAAGRLMANVLASVAAYENEVRGERIRAGQAVARSRGKQLGGSAKGRRLKVTVEQQQAIQRLSADGEGPAAIARATGLSRPCSSRRPNSAACGRSWCRACCHDRRLTGGVPLLAAPLVRFRRGSHCGVRRQAEGRRAA